MRRGHQLHPVDRPGADVRRAAQSRLHHQQPGRRADAPTSTCTPSMRATWLATGRPASGVARQSGRRRSVGGRRISPAVVRSALGSAHHRPDAAGVLQRAVRTGNICSRAIRRADAIGLACRGAVAHGGARVPGARLAILDRQSGHVSVPGVPVGAGCVHPSTLAAECDARPGLPGLCCC